jgi:excisionase family DNA binding protein
MSIGLHGEVYYRTTEACQMIGISRATLFRWISEGIVEDVALKDRRGWRLFTENDLHRLKVEVNKVSRSSR